MGGEVSRGCLVGGSRAGGRVFAVAVCRVVAVAGCLRRSSSFVVARRRGRAVVGALVEP